MPPIIFVGNKKDLTDVDPRKRAISPEDVAQVMRTCEDLSSRLHQKTDSTRDRSASGWPMLHFEASALSGERIDEMFEILIREIKDRKKGGSRISKKKSSNWFDKWCIIL